MRKVTFEHTDLFNGEPNYAWVRRETHEVDDKVSDLALVRRAKKFASFTGLRCRVIKYDSYIEIRPYGGWCEVCFVIFD